MSPFDRAHTTSYSTLIVSMCLSCTVFEIKPVIHRKSPTLTHPTYIRRPRRGWPGRISRRSLAPENKNPWAVVWCCLLILCLAVLVELRLVTDRQTDTDRHGHRPMASTVDAWHRAVKIWSVIMPFRELSFKYPFINCGVFIHRKHTYTDKQGNRR